MTRWWRESEGERFWLETTDRSDVGVDLNAPAHDDAGNRHAAYAIITAVKASDIVFHYEKPLRAVTSWSRVVGEPWMDEVVWAHMGLSPGQQASSLTAEKVGVSVWKVPTRWPNPLDGRTSARQEELFRIEMRYFRPTANQSTSLSSCLRRGLYGQLSST